MAYCDMKCYVILVYLNSFVLLKMLTFYLVVPMLKLGAEMPMRVKKTMKPNHIICLLELSQIVIELIERGVIL